MGLGLGLGLGLVLDLVQQRVPVLGQLDVTRARDEHLERAWLA